MTQRTTIKILILTAILILGFSTSSSTHAFIRITDLVFDGEPVDPDELDETLETIKINRRKNQKNEQRGKKKRFPTKLTTIEARQRDPENIQIEVDTSDVIVVSNDDIQSPISNVSFLNAINEAIGLWGNVDIANVNFLPVKFASGQPDSDDGKNVITFRATGDKELEGIPTGTPVFTIINYARDKTVLFMNKVIMVKPGTILDADIIFDPTNDVCLALHTTVGDIKIGGDDVAIADGGIDPDADLSNCEVVKAGDITDLAVRSIAHLLGLENSGIISAAAANPAQIMTRYALTNDDRIGLSNIYPNKAALTNDGSLIGKVLLNRKPVIGAHIVLEDSATGEPTTGGITDIKGKFVINSIPAGTYNVYIEPLDGPVRKAGFPFSFFGFNSTQNFVTLVLEDPVVITANKRTNLKKVTVQELSASAFNINHLVAVLTEEDVNLTGGAFLLPIRIMAGETLTTIPFWGSNINPNFGNLSISGTGITLTNVTEVENIPISPFIKCADCEETADTMCNRDPRCPPTQELDIAPDEIPGLTVDITCAAGTAPGPRDIIFTGDLLDEASPSFGLRDQISGGLIVTED